MTGTTLRARSAQTWHVPNTFRKSQHRHRDGWRRKLVAHNPIIAQELHVSTTAIDTIAGIVNNNRWPE